MIEVVAINIIVVDLIDFEVFEVNKEIVYQGKAYVGNQVRFIDKIVEHYVEIIKVD